MFGKNVHMLNRHCFRQSVIRGTYITKRKIVFQNIAIKKHIDNVILTYLNTMITNTPVPNIFSPCMTTCLSQPKNHTDLLSDNNVLHN